MVVCLDVDGCLIDSDVPMVRAMASALQAFAMSPMALSELRPHLGPPLVVTMESILTARGADPRQAADLAIRYRTAYAETSTTRVTVYDGMVDALDQLLEWGHRLVVVTSKPPAYSTPVLEAAGLLHRFDGVFGPLGDETEPKQVTLARALSQLGSESAVVVGDTVQDVLAAHANGVACIAVTWGYGAVTDLEDVGADRVIDAPSDLPAAVDAVTGTADPTRSPGDGRSGEVWQGGP
jgi:phosphoglycolate phosphatase